VNPVIPASVRRVQEIHVCLAQMDITLTKEAAQHANIQVAGHV